MKYENDINGAECINDIFELQNAVQSNIPEHIKYASATVLELHQMIQEYSLKE